MATMAPYDIAEFGTGTSTAYFGRAQAVVKLITIICRHDYCLPRGARPARFTA